MAVAIDTAPMPLGQAANALRRHLAGRPWLHSVGSARLRGDPATEGTDVILVAVHDLHAARVDLGPTLLQWQGYPVLVQKKGRISF